MYWLTKMCYVCHKQNDKSLMNINTSLALNKDIMHIIGYLPCNLGWMKTKQIILLCKQCCLRLRETYQFLVMCDKNSAVMQGYLEKLDTASVSDTNKAAELRVDIVRCEIKSQDEESGLILEETEVLFMDVDDSLVKDEDTWEREEVGDKEEPPMENNSTASSAKVTDMMIHVNGNTHDTGTASAGSESTSTQVNNETKPKAAAKRPYKCLICPKSFTRKELLNNHTRVHTGEKPFKCAVCARCYTLNSTLLRHMRLHSGDKPFQCPECKKCVSDRSNLVAHMRIHTGEKPFECPVCKRCFAQKQNVTTHMRLHTGEKPYECSRCDKRYSDKSALLYHMRTHTGENAYECTKCKKYLSCQSSYVNHMRIHAADRPFECSECLKCFRTSAGLFGHMRRKHIGNDEF